MKTASAETEITQLSWRYYAALLVAFVADAAQVGTTILTFGGDLVLIPFQMLFAAIVSVVLALLIGRPHPKLIPGAFMEIAPVPGLELLPSFSLSAAWVIRSEQAALRRAGDRNLSDRGEERVVDVRPQNSSKDWPGFQEQPQITRKVAQHKQTR